MATGRVWLVALAMAFGAAAAAADEPHPEGNVTAAIAPASMGAYVVVDDVEVSARFYRSVLGKAPAIQTPVFVSFEVAGGVLAVVFKAAFAPDSKIGDNAVPYIRVADIDAAFAHAARVVPEAMQSVGVLREGPIALFKMRDPDGNLVEFYSLTNPVIRPAPD